MDQLDLTHFWQATGGAGQNGPGCPVLPPLGEMYGKEISKAFIQLVKHFALVLRTKLNHFALLFL